MLVSDLKEYLNNFDDNQEIDFSFNPCRGTDLENEDSDLKLKIELQGVGNEIPTIFATLKDKYDGNFETISEELENPHTEEISIKLTKEGLFFTCLQDNKEGLFREMEFITPYKSLQDVPKHLLLTEIVRNL